MSLLDKFRSFAARSPDSMPVFIIRFFFRFLQMIVGLVVIGMYATDVHDAAKRGVSVDGRWAYGVAVGTLSFILALAFCIPRLASSKIWPGDALMWLFYLVLFGIFGKLFIGEDCEGNGKCNRMKTAVWFDLIGMLLWFGTGVMGLVLWLKGRRYGGSKESVVV